MTTTQQRINARYEALNHWIRLDLERYAIHLTHDAGLVGATKIRLLRAILDAEWATPAIEGSSQ
jgi:hypothetical protein